MSTGCLGNVCLPPSPYKISHVGEENYHIQNSIHKQGFEFENNLTSIRRSISSVDMLALNQSTLKRTQSSDHLAFLPDHHDHDHHDQDQTHDQRKGAFEDIWTSIQKNNGARDQPPPYVHPLVKRSTSLLSQKSLEVCTESLGSETGSETEIVINTKAVLEDLDQCTVLPSSRKSLPLPLPTTTTPAAAVVVPTRSLSFPPPLPSLTRREGGSNLQMRSHRHEGRLILEAVPVPTVHRFHAHRHGGRLRLTLSEDESDEEEEDQDQNQDQEEEEEELAIVMEPMKMTSSSTLIMSKQLGQLTNTKKNLSAWPRSFNATIVTTRRPVMLTSATALNAYEYCWRRRENGVAVLKPVAQGNNNNNNNNIERKLLTTVEGGERKREVVVEKKKEKEKEELKVGEEEYLVPLYKACKKPTRRRSLLFWDSEPYWIATS